MKTKHIGLVLAALAIAGLWIGRMVWRAHHNLVTLHARNRPLAEVARSLQWQTWERIRFDKSMKAKVTLNVQDAPLVEVLDLVADRAGARWQKTYAVGVSDGALVKLETVLDGGAKLAEVGWTNLAPQFPEMKSDPPPGVELEPHQEMPGRILQHRVMTGGISSGSGPGAGGGARMVTIGPGGTVDHWSSERLVLESRLLPVLGANAPEEATAETAAQVASSVHGRSRLYYALEKSPFEMGHMAGGGRVLRGPRVAHLDHPAPDDPIANMAHMAQQRRLREMSRSPEEQVERARQNGPHKMRMETDQESN